MKEHTFHVFVMFLGMAIGHLVGCDASTDGPVGADAAVTNNSTTQSDAGVTAQATNNATATQADAGKTDAGKADAGE